MKLRFTSGIEWARCQVPSREPDRASKHLCHFKRLAKRRRRIPVVLYVRVSGWPQKWKRKRNLDIQEASLRRKVERLGGIVVAVYREVESGWRVNQWQRDKLMAAVATAKRHGAVIVAESTDRLIRSRWYSDKNQDATPSAEEFERLLEWADGVTLATFLHPDTPPREVRGYQSKRGQVGKCRKGGRPRVVRPGYKKKRRLELMAKARRLRRRGSSIRRIAKRLKLAKSTVGDWVAN